MSFERTNVKLISLNELLVVKSASFYSSVFANQAIGLERALFYSILIEFNSLKVNGLNLNCNVNSDWNCIEDRRWKEIDVELGNEIQPESEWSFYTTSHDWIDRVKGKLQFRNQGFYITLELSTTLEHVFEEKLVLNQTIETDIIYEGLIIVPQNLELEVHDVKRVREAAGEFVDLRDYEEPIFENNFRYLFKPKNYSV